MMWYVIRDKRYARCDARKCMATARITQFRQDSSLERVYDAPRITHALKLVDNHAAISGGARAMANGS
jgi:hypothetical protein